MNSQALAPQQAGQDMMSVEQTRAATEIQSQIEVAIKFPRDEERAHAQLMKSCQRKTFAERALYAYKRGDGLVTGPSISMAKEAARLWGHIRFGWVELQRRGPEITGRPDGESLVQTFAHDLQTNTQDTRVFTVRHLRQTRNGEKVLTDERDIYETIANQAARRMRQCIFELLPADIVEDAVSQVGKTMAGDEAVPLAERIEQTIAKLEELGVTREQIATKLGHKIEATTEHELVTLRAARRSIEDQFTTVAALFGSGEESTGEPADEAPEPADEPSPAETPGDKPDVEDLVARIELADSEQEVSKLVIEGSQLGTQELERVKKTATARRRKFKKGDEPE